VSWSTVVFPSAMNRLLKFRLNEQLLFLLNQRLQRRFQQTRRENDSTSWPYAWSPSHRTGI